MLLNNEWVNNEIKEETKKYLETNKNKYTTTQYLWDTVKAVLRGKFITIQAYQKETEKSQINNLTLHAEKLEDQQTKLRVSRRKEIIKIRVELNDIKTKNTSQRINESRSWFFEKINKIDKLLKRLMKKKRERNQVNSKTKEKK